MHELRERGGKKRKSWEMNCWHHFLCVHGINIRDHRVLLLTQPGSLHTMSFPDCFVTNITHTSSRLLKWERPSKRRTIRLSFSLHSLYPWGFLFFFWLFEATSQKVIFHLTTSPVPQSARWQINPVGLLGVLCLQMARRCWWGTLVYRRLHGRMCRGEVLQSVSNSNTIWTVKCQGEMWGMDEPAP